MVQVSRRQRREAKPSRGSKGWMMTSSLLVGLVGLSTLSWGFKYQIEDKYTDTSKWSFTETYMYGSGKVSEWLYCSEHEMACTIGLFSDDDKKG